MSHKTKIKHSVVNRNRKIKEKYACETIDKYLKNSKLLIKTGDQLSSKKFKKLIKEITSYRYIQNNN